MESILKVTSSRIVIHINTVSFLLFNKQIYTDKCLKININELHSTIVTKVQCHCIHSKRAKYCTFCICLQPVGNKNYILNSFAREPIASYQCSETVISRYQLQYLVYLYLFSWQDFIEIIDNVNQLIILSMITIGKR